MEVNLDEIACEPPLQPRLRRPLRPPRLVDLRHHQASEMESDRLINKLTHLKVSRENVGVGHICLEEQFHSQKMQCFIGIYEILAMNINDF